MATATQTLPNIQQITNMNSYSDIVNQTLAQVSNPTQDAPVELNDHRMKNKLFLIHPDLLDKLEYTYTPPPPPHRFKLQCLQDFIDKGSNKHEHHDNDDYNDIYNDIYNYNEDRLYETPRFNNLDDYNCDYHCDYHYETEYDSEYDDYEKDLDI